MKISCVNIKIEARKDRGQVNNLYEFNIMRRQDVKTQTVDAVVEPGVSREWVAGDEQSLLIQLSVILLCVPLINRIILSFYPTECGGR